jgi:hypothetical protein
LIFISYSQTPDWARSIRASALERGSRAWLDVVDLDVRAPLAPQIVGAIARSAAVLVLDSPAARRSSWVSFERRVARSLGRPLLVLRA